MSAPLFLLHVRFVTDAGEVLLCHLTCCRVDKNTHLGRRKEREEEEREEGRGRRKGRRRVGGGEGEWV